MTGRRAAAGLALACAFAFSALAAPSAMAVNGTTAFTCVNKPEPFVNGFSDAHCKTSTPSATFVHKEITQDETTIFHATNEKTNAGTTAAEPFILKGKPLGIETEVTCKKVTEHGHITNRLNATTKEHWIEAPKITIHLTECNVNKPSGCKIPSETILIEGVKSTTQGQEMNVKFEPEVGTTFVEIAFTNCTNGLFNGKHKLEGSYRGQTEGATLVFNHATITTENTLKFFGAAAGLQGKTTQSQAEATEEAAKTGNPITTTTVT